MGLGYMFDAADDGFDPAEFGDNRIKAAEWSMVDGRLIRRAQSEWTARTERESADDALGEE